VLYSGDAKYFLRNHIRRQRREEGIDRAAIAISYRIPTASRFHRACILAHGKTPLQIEMEVLTEVTRELTEEPAHVHNNTEKATTATDSPPRLQDSKNGETAGDRGEG
jgi:hypothetical protein